MNNQYELYHYGILGMKWRFHRKKKEKEPEDNAISKAASKVSQVSQRRSAPVTLKEVTERNAKETKEKRVSESSTSAARREKIKTIASKKSSKRNSHSTSEMRSEKIKQKGKERVARIVRRGLSIDSARKEIPKVKNFIKKTTVRFKRFSNTERFKRFRNNGNE